MNTELAKTYDPSAVESTAYQVWMEENCFRADPAAPGDPYSIVIPPPNVTGALHLGHAINSTLQDILTRQHRMRGFNTLWVPGIDHAGIATQAVVEKQLKEKENKTRHDVGREGLIERIWTWKQQYGDRIIEQLKRLGCSCDWSRTRFTLDEMCARAVRETFFKLFKDGLIYRGKRLVNWDTFLQTSISDDEIYHETVKTNLWHIRYPIEGAGEGLEFRVQSSDAGGYETDSRGTGVPPVSSALIDEAPLNSKYSATPHGRDAHATGGATTPAEPGTSNPVDRPAYMIVVTTRPETMLGDTAVAVHPDDPRWNWAIGQHVRLPLTNRLIPIIADAILVDPKFGTGVVKVTPAHDPNDHAVWQRHKGHADEIDLINILTPDGRIVEDARWQKYAGMKRDAARQQVLEDLKGAGLLEKEEPYETQVGHSDRSKTPIEPYLSDQWFVRMAPLAEPALEVVRDGLIRFYPERHAQQYLAWLGEKRDWPVSRQLWWGHRIPVWTKSWGPELASDAIRRFRGEPAALVQDRFPYLDKDELTKIAFGLNVITAQVAVAPLQHDIERKLEAHGYIQDPDVLDTWFSSALWPHSTLGWPEPTPELAKYYPTSVLVTGRDIITLWVARMVMMGMYNMGEKGRRDEGTERQSEEDATPATPLQADSASRGTGVSPVRSARLVGEQQDSQQETTQHGRDAHATTELARQLGIPFFDVAINPTILDGKGERMSKSKGNGVDPVDIIDAYGADALRFTLTKMATETQDARMPVKRDAQGRNTSEKFDEGRNFCNKLWNACRFALANLESVRGLSSSDTAQKVDETKWSMADRWIVSRFNRTVQEADQALADYRFDVYAKTCYDFFWRDFCDWYVEAIKPAMKDQARAAQTGHVLAAVLDGALRLMHPMIPFITETVWWRLNEVRPERGLPGRIECSPSDRLVLAKWPTVGSFAEAAEFIFPRLQEIIGAIRNLRNEHQVKPSQTVAISIRAPDDSARQIETNRETIELLASCTLKEVRADFPAPANAATATAAGCEIFIEDLVNADAEKQRLAKSIADKQRTIDSMKARLSNESYIAKAPPKLVQETRDQLAAAEAELEKMGEAIKTLG